MRRGSEMRATAMALLIAATPAQADKITGFGDSITEGDGSSFDGYPHWLGIYQSVATPGNSIVNAGIGGETTQMGLYRFASATAGSDVVLIMEGTNDISQGVSTATTVANLTQMGQASNIPIMACVIPRYGDPWNRDPNNRAARKLEGDLAVVCSQYGWAFVDMFALFDGQLGWYWNYLHPNDDGYIHMARAWQDALGGLYGYLTVSSVTPSAGAQGQNTSVTITGSGFAAGASGYVGLFGNQILNVQVTSPTTATGEIPGTLPQGAFDIGIKNAGGSGGWLYDGFTMYGQAPVVASITPFAAPSTASTTVVITGSNFDPTPSVSIGSYPLGGVVYGGSTTLTAVVPAGIPPGNYDVTVTNPNTLSGTLTGGYWSQGPPPVINSVSPTVQDNNVAFTLTADGANFIAGADLEVGGVSISVTSVTATQVAGTVPVGFAAGTYDVAVFLPDGQYAVLAQAIQIQNPAPIITSVAPVPLEAGVRGAITIDGSYFQSGATGAVGSAPLSDVVFVSAAQLTATVPAGLTEGSYDLTITNPDGRSGTLAGGAILTDTTAPVVADAYPLQSVVGAPPQPALRFYLRDPGSGVDASSLTVNVAGGAVTVAVSGPPTNLRVDYRPSTRYTTGQVVDVQVSGTDLASTPNPFGASWTFTVTSSTDGDGDALPDEWETAHALSPLSATGAEGATGDPDRDLAGNATEYAAGTDATSKLLLLVAPGPAAMNAPLGRALFSDGTAVATSAPLYPVNAYGANVAAADVNGGGFDEVIAGPGPGVTFGPQVRGLSDTFSSIAKINYYAYGTLKYGVRVGGGELDGDGLDEILTGPGPGNVFGPHVRGFNFDNVAVTAMGKVSFYAYSTLKYGVNVGAGDIDGDGYGEIVTAPGPGAVFGPHVRGFNFDNATLSAMGKVSFFAYGTLKYGAQSAEGDVDRDGYDEILTGPGPGVVFGSQVRGFNFDGVTLTPVGAINFVAFAGSSYGATVASGDVDGDRRSEIVAGEGYGPGNEARLRWYTTSPVTQAGDVFGFQAELYGVNVAVLHGSEFP